MMSAKVIAQVSTQMLKVGLRRDFHELTLTEFSKVGKVENICCLLAKFVGNFVYH